MSTLALSPTETNTTRSSTLRPRLRTLSFDQVGFDLHDRYGFVRGATVAVGSGNSSWHSCCRFPNWSSGESGETTGDDDLDEEIRTRAADFLTVLESTTNVRAAA